VRRQEAGAEEGVGHAAVVAGEEAQQQLGQLAAALQAQPAHDAEVERHDGAVGRVDQHVAGVHVGVEEAVAEDLVEEDGGGALEDPVGLQAGGGQPVEVGERQAR
jgi:hypothetical protein